MTSIAVDKKGFLTELLSWQVPAEYAAAFVNKNAGNNGRIILHPFFFNDTEHLTNSRHWLAINAAFWCRAFREAEGVQNQIETLAGVRAIYYAAGALGVGEVKALIQGSGINFVDCIVLQKNALVLRGLGFILLQNNIIILDNMVNT